MKSTYSGFNSVILIVFLLFGFVVGAISTTTPYIEGKPLVGLHKCRRKPTFTIAPMLAIFTFHTVSF